MKKFVFKTSIFLILILFVLALLEYSLRVIPNVYSYKNQYLENNSKEIELLVLGNSHAFKGVLAEDLMPNGFNASYISQTLNLDFLIFHKFKSRLTNLKYLVINISYPSLFSSLKENKEKWRLKNYNIYYGFNESSNIENYFELLSNSKMYTLSRFKGYYFDKLNTISCSKYGDELSSLTNNFKKTGVEAAARHTNDELLYYKGYIAELNEIIEYANLNKIKVVLITTPVYKDYLENLNNKQLMLMNDTVDSIVDYNLNTYRFNYMIDNDFIEDDFYDSDHLNRNGALKLTKKLKYYIDTL